MKTNILVNNTNMKQYIKYLCAVVLMLGMSISAWGAIYIEYDGNKYYNGDKITINVDLDDDVVASADAMTIKNDGTGWTSSTWYYGYIYATISGTYVYSNLAFGMAGVEGKNGTPYWIHDDHYTSFYEWNNWQYETLSFYTSYAFDAAGTYNSTITVVQKDDDDASTLQSASITVSYVVTAVCATPTVAFADETVYKDKDASSFTKTATVKVGGSGTGQSITYTSSNTDVATVGSTTGTVTLKGVVGSTTITATAAEKEGEYCEATGSYTLYVYTTPSVNNTHMGGTKTPTSATFSGCQVSNKGGLAIQQYGWVIGTTNPVDGSNKTTWAGFNADIDVNTDFASATTKADLTPGTTYYVKAFANNGKAIGYSEQVSITTPYLITLNKNNSDASGSTNGSAYVTPNGTSLGSITAPTRTGYDVEGYYTTSDFGAKVATSAGALQASITVSATAWTDENSKWTRGAAETFYAKWTAKEYTVTFDQNGGSGGSSNVTATFGSAMPSATMPTTPPTGKTFDGYYYNSVKYYNADGSSAHVWDVAGAATLVASWTTATPTLKIASVDKVVISSTAPSLAEGASTSVAYNSTVTLSHGDPESGYYWLDWNVYETGNESNTLTVTSNQFTMPDHDVTVSANLYTGLVFSCSELTLTPHLVTASTPIFITSVANKKVRSQDYITITGSGLTPNTPLTFPGLNSKFEVLTATGGTISTDASGAINENAYIFYTPAADATTDGLDQMAGLTVSVGGAKPKQASLPQNIIGRHLPTAGYVIAGKKDGKWYALPSNMASTGTPTPSEIAVDNINNPSIAYTAATNIYGLEGPVASNISGGNGQYVRLTMSIESSEGSGKPAPLFGTSGSEDASNSPKVGKSGTAIATNTLSEGWWWSLTQTNTSITNPQDAKYIVKCANNSNTLSIKNSPFVWGLYASGVEELRLIPASNVVFTEAYFVAWGQHNAIVEVDRANAGGTGVAAAKVKALLNGAESSLIALTETGTSKGSSSKYNYTVAFGDVIDFAAAANAGQMLTLEWYNSSDALIAVSNIMVPTIVASNITINKTNYSLKSAWNTEVHVLPNVTVTVDASAYDNSDVTIKELNIYPGATVNVTAGTLKATTLVMRNGWNRLNGEKIYDVARLYVGTSANLGMPTNAYADWYIDYDQYYPVAVPWKVTLATGLQYRYTKVSPTYGYDKNIRLLYYDGEGRVKGTNGSAGDGANWRFYGAPGGKAMPATLDPSKAYAMTAKRPTGKAFSIIRMTMEVPSADWTTSGEQGQVIVDAVTTHKDTVNVVAYNNAQGNAAEYAKGWNFIANPYMSLYQGQIGYTEGEETVKYVNIPDEKFKEYDQQLTLTAKLKPASGVLIQAPETGRLIFGTANRKLSMPSFYSETQKEKIPEQQVVVVLSDETNEDMMGLLVSDKYTAEYEINADLEKLLSDGNTLRTYMRYGDMNMAYVAINETLAKEWIPVSVRIPADGEYTFSLHEASIAGELEGVYLIDYQNGDKITNLIEQSYTFSSTAGTINGRFAINAKVGERQTPTGIDAINAGGDINSDKPFKFIYHDKVYIWLNGVIFDTTGKRVK